MLKAQGHADRHLRLAGAVLAAGCLLSACGGEAETQPAAIASPSPPPSPSPSPSSLCDVEALIAAADAVAADNIEVRKAAADYPALVRDAAEGGSSGSLAGILPRLMDLQERLTTPESLAVADTYAAARSACAS